MDAIPPAFDAAAFLGWIAPRSAVISLIAVGVSLAMSRRSASERHVVLAMAVGAMLLLPVAWPVAARHSVPVEAPAIRAAAVWLSWDGTFDARDSAHPHEAAAISHAPRRIGIAEGAMAALFAGMAVQALLTVAGWLQLAGMVRNGQAFPLPEGVEVPSGRGHPPTVRLVPGARTPFVWGLRRPMIALPASALGWPRERLEMVLCHEAAHLRRRDHWLHPVCALFRITYWWQPFAWLLLARLRREQERACDDRVLEDFRATDYSALLVQVAREAGRGGHAALAMATRPGIGRRVRAALDPSLSRRPARWRLAWVAGTAALLLATTLCMVRAVVANTPNPERPDTSEPTHAERIEIHGTLVEIVRNARATRATFAGLLDNDDGASREAFEDALDDIRLKKGVDLLKLPPLVTDDGKAVRFEVVREFKFGVEFARDGSGVREPTKFDSRNLGIEIDVTPTTTGEGVLLSGSAKMTEYEGATSGADGIEMPVFAIKEARFLREAREGRIAGVRLWNRDDEQVVTETLPGGGTEERRERISRELTMFLWVQPPGEAGHRKQPPPAGETSPPFGVPVAGKPGFVKSPYAPDDGEVDVTGFPSTTEVKCPFTGRIFLVP